MRAFRRQIWATYRIKNTNIYLFLSFELFPSFQLTFSYQKLEMVKDLYGKFLGNAVNAKFFAAVALSFFQAFSYAPHICSKSGFLN